jgi:predicted kinase
MHGLPGAGKSAFARQFSELLGITHINTDRIRYELFDDAQFNPAENNTVLRLADYMSDTLLSSGQSIIFDMHLPTKILRKAMKKMADNNSAAFLLIWVQTDKDTAQFRSSHRDRRKPDDKYSFNLSSQTFEMLSKRVSPPAGETTVVISGKHLFKYQSAGVLRKLQYLKVIEIDSLSTPRNSGRVDLNRRAPNRLGKFVL